MHNRLSLDIKMRATTGDLSFFYKHGMSGELKGMVRAYVDYTLKAGSKEFETLAQETDAKFESKRREYDNFSFAGIRVDQTESGFLLYQKRYIRSLRLLPMDVEFD